MTVVIGAGAAGSPAVADCAALNICSKTIVAKTKYGTERVYVAADGNVFATMSGGTITDKIGDNIVGTQCSVAGATQTISCPGPNCTNTYRNSNNRYSQTETTLCKVIYEDSGFVLQVKLTSSMKQDMFMAGQSHHQSTSQNLTSEERFTISQKSCSIHFTSTNNMSTSNTWMPASKQTINDSYSSTTCSLLDGRQL